MNFTPLWTAALNAFSNFIIVDERCRIAYMNKPYTEILNIKLEDVIGKPIKSIIPTTKLPEVMASGKADIGALMTLYDHKTSRDIRFVCNRIPLIEDGEIIGGVAISTFNEMGEIYHLYSEVEKMQQQNELYQQTIEQLRKQTNPLDYIIGSSQAIGHIKSTIAIFANSGLSLLLTGETGVGKEVFANALHQLSSRSASNFVKINCAAIPKDLLESELFGHDHHRLGVETLVDRNHQAQVHAGRNHLVDRNVHHRRQLADGDELGHFEDRTLLLLALHLLVQAFGHQLAFLLAVLGALRLGTLRGQACQRILHLLCYLLVAHFGTHDGFHHTGALLLVAAIARTRLTAAPAGGIAAGLRTAAVTAAAARRLRAVDVHLLLRQAFASMLAARHHGRNVDLAEHLRARQRLGRRTENIVFLLGLPLVVGLLLRLGRSQDRKSTRLNSSHL